MATSNNNVIVSRIQNRRGLKQDLPNPLRPGEMGLATDSKQVYIGSDPAIDRENSKFLSIENHNQAKTQSVSIPHNQIIKFTVPHIYTQQEHLQVLKKLLVTLLVQVKHIHFQMLVQILDKHLQIQSQMGNL